MVVRSLDLAAHCVIACAANGTLDFDDVGAPVGELAHGGWAGAVRCQIEDLEAGQGTIVHWETSLGSQDNAAGGMNARGEPTMNAVAEAIDQLELGRPCRGLLMRQAGRGMDIGACSVQMRSTLCLNVTLPQSCTGVSSIQ